MSNFGHIMRSVVFVFRWYHGRIGREDGEKLLMNSGNLNAFLVRESVTKPGDYVISVRTDIDEIINILVSYLVSGLC